MKNIITVVRKSQLIGLNLQEVIKYDSTYYLKNDQSNKDFSVIYIGTGLNKKLLGGVTPSIERI